MPVLTDKVAEIIDPEAFGEDVNALYDAAAGIDHDKSLAEKARYRSGGIMNWGVRRKKARTIANEVIALVRQEISGEPGPVCAAQREEVAAIPCVQTQSD